MTDIQREIQTGEIPLDDLYDVLTNYRDEIEYVISVLRARLDYSSAHTQTPEPVTAAGSITHCPGDGETSWWLGVDDEIRDREVALELSHDDYGNEQWRVVNDEGRTLGILQSIEVGRDV